MALRVFPKINRYLTQNLGKVFYSKKSDATATVRKLDDSDATKSDETKKQHYTANKPLLRTGSERLDSEAKLMQKNMQLHQLQPALLPNYYKPPTDVQGGIFPKTPELPNQFKRLEQSITHKNVKLPFKKPRLANPFPDPVKVMQSDTVSDQEKADQMQASARIGFSQCRSYSTSSSYKKINNPEGKCKKLKADKCKPRARKSCEVEYVFQTGAVLLQTPAISDALSTNNVEVKKKRRSTSGGNKPCPRPKSQKCETEDSKSKKKKNPKKKAKGKKRSNSSRSWETLVDAASVRYFPSLLSEQVPSREEKLITEENIFNLNSNRSINANKSSTSLPNPVPILDYIPPLFCNEAKFVPKKSKLNMGSSTPWATLESSESVQFPSSTNGTSSMMLKKKKKPPKKKDDKGKKKDKKPKKKSKGKKCADCSRSWETIVDSACARLFPLLFSTKTELLNEEYFSTAWVALNTTQLVHFPSSTTRISSMMPKKKKKKGPKKDDIGKKNKKLKKKSKGKEYMNSSKSWVTLVDPASVCGFPSFFSNKTKLLNEEFSSTTWDSLESSELVHVSSTSGTNSMMLKKKKKSNDKKGKSEKNKCKKFPFTGCENKQKKRENSSKRCPKPKKKKIKDCPPSPNSKCISISEAPTLRLLNGAVIENSCRFAYLCRRNKGDEDDENCPDVDLSICESKKKKNDSCDGEQKGSTKVCPTDLLEKKKYKPRKPQKKSMEENAPLMSMMQSSPDSPIRMSPV